MAEHRDGEVVWLPLDVISRHAQIRARTDPKLIDEYARLMLDGTFFPPVVVFEEHRDGEVLYHLGDGYHRFAAWVQARAMKRWRKEIRAEVWPGTFEDALRHAMQANSEHGKRLEQADQTNAIGMALRHGLVQVARPSDVVPALQELIPGLSARWARACTVLYRRELTENRDRLITQLHGEGLTQAAIAERLEIDQATVSRTIAAAMQNGSAAETHRSEMHGAPEAEAAEDIPEDPQAVQRLAEIKLAADEFLQRITDQTALEGHFTAASAEATLSSMYRVAAVLRQVVERIRSAPAPGPRQGAAPSAQRAERAWEIHQAMRQQNLTEESPR